MSESTSTAAAATATETERRGKHPAITVLQLLLDGHTVRLGNLPPIALREGQLVTILDRMGDLSKALAPFPLTLEAFITRCELLPDSEVFLMGAEHALTQLHRTRRGRGSAAGGQGTP